MAVLTAFTLRAAFHLAPRQTEGLIGSVIGLLGPALAVPRLHPMTLVFHDPLDLFAIAGTALFVNPITSDSQAAWFEGVLLIGVYAVFGIGFFFA